MIKRAVKYMKYASVTIKTEEYQQMIGEKGEKKREEGSGKKD